MAHEYVRRYGWDMAPVEAKVRRSRLVRNSTRQEFWNMVVTLLEDNWKIEWRRLARRNRVQGVT
jgi:hypothetical protein